MANYHVNYLTGSDSTGDGSTGTPWQTISHALTIIFFSQYLYNVHSSITIFTFKVGWSSIIT